MIKLLLYLFLSIAPTCFLQAQAPWATPAQLETLYEWMSGSFSSAEQAASDSAYFDIRLHMRPVWPEQKDGKWLYVEQAVVDYQEKPYRQRVYQLILHPGEAFESRVYSLPDPLRFAGEWKKEYPLAQFQPDSLILLKGCSIMLRWEEGEFRGGTVEERCQSNYRGAAYTRSDVRITENQMISWDRGFDKEGQQVWGAEKGGYIFKKVED